MKTSFLLQMVDIERFLSTWPLLPFSAENASPNSLFDIYYDHTFSVRWWQNIDIWKVIHSHFRIAAILEGSNQRMKLSSLEKRLSFLKLRCWISQTWPKYHRQCLGGFMGSFRYTYVSKPSLKNKKSSNIRNKANTIAHLMAPVSQ